MLNILQYDHVITAILVLIFGFGFHWVGQTLSLINWDLATRLGLQEVGAPKEYTVYEHAIAVADVSIGWVYGLAGIGLLMNADWGFKLAWIPGAVLIYHAVSFWTWTGNQLRAGINLSTGRMPFRVGWTFANLLTGILALIIAWNGP